MLSDNNPLEEGAAITESDLDENYILTKANTEDSEKAKLFECFIADLKEVLQSD